MPQNNSEDAHMDWQIKSWPWFLCGDGALRLLTGNWTVFLLYDIGTVSNKPQQLVLKLKGPSSVSFCLYIQNPATNIQRFNGVGPARKTVKSDLKGVVKYIYWFRCGCVASRALKSLLYYLDVPRDKVIDKVTTRHVGSDINWSDFYCSEGTIQ